jgi:DNA (cytosine-5)-methyltransferase 1
MSEKIEVLNVLDLFAGVGTFSFAMEQILYKGQKVFNTIGFCEIDKDCHRVLRKNFPNVTIYEDVSDLNKKKLRLDGVKKVDVICGGFPCTDISTAGKQKGLHDEELLRSLIEQGMSREDAEKQTRTRSGLWSEYFRLIKEIEPKFVIIENVANLRSNGLGRVLKDLSSIGYNAEWEIISARDVGQCHLRERIWIIAYPDSKRTQIQTSREHPTDSLSRSKSQTGRAGDIDERLDQWKDSSDCDSFRFWPTFTSEEAKSEWWSRATSDFYRWREAQPEAYGIYDGPTRGLHEKFRRARIKQCGNGIVRSIAQIIAERIAYHEFRKEAL